MYQNIYFYLKKQKENKKTKEKKEKKQAKETKEEKRISVENLAGYDDIVCEFALCTSCREFLLVVHMNLV